MSQTTLRYVHDLPGLKLGYPLLWVPDNDIQEHVFSEYPDTDHERKVSENWTTCVCCIGNN